MYCENCGQKLPEGAKFCNSCGAPVVSEAAAEPEMREDAGYQKVTENILLCPDGKYRWVYEFEMLKNPTVLITVLKVMLLSFGIVLGVMALVNLIGGDFRYWNASDFASFGRGMLIFLAGVLVISVIAYLILAGIYGWSYQVLIVMDENGVEQKMMKKEFAKAQALGWLTAAASLASGNVGRAGTGIMAATRDTSSSEFKRVKKVKAVRRRHVIYVNQTLEHNQVYAEDADFDFVRDYIVSHCPGAKVIG